MARKVSEGGDRTVKVDAKLHRHLMRLKADTNVPIKHILRRAVMEGTIKKV